MADTRLDEVPYVFVSYSHADTKPVAAEVDWLREEHFDVRYDGDVTSTEDWEQTVAPQMFGESCFSAGGHGGMIARKRKARNPSSPLRGPSPQGEGDGVEAFLFIPPLPWGEGAPKGWVRGSEFRWSTPEPENRSMNKKALAKIRGWNPAPQVPYLQCLWSR